MDFEIEAGTRFLVTAGVRILGTRAGEVYRSDGKNLVLESLRKKTKIVGPIKEALTSGYFRKCDPILPYSLQDMLINEKGRVISRRYLIPDADREKVLKQLWPFKSKPPKLTAQKFDLHAGKFFTVATFEVFREEESNYLVSPFYAGGGGTVIDWMSEDWAQKNGY